MIFFLTAIINGWKAAGIADALELVSKNLPSIDPFDDISPLVNRADFATPSMVNVLTQELRQSFVNEAEKEDSDCEGEDEEEDVDLGRNAFDTLFDDE